MNSSDRTGVAANCELIFLPSPLFEHIRLSSVKLGNFNNMQAFIFTKRDIQAGEELRWKYSCDQAYRDECPASPAILVTTPNPVKRGATSEASRIPVKAAKVDVKPAAAACVPHNCRCHTTCKKGRCSECACSACRAQQVQVGIPRSRTPWNPYGGM